MSIDRKSLMTSVTLAPRGIPVRTKGCCQPLAAPLPEADAAQLAQVFRALDDPTRVQMVHLLTQATEPVCVCDFTATFNLGQPTISHHLARLRQAGLVTSFRRGLWSFHQLDPEMAPAARRAVEVIRSAATPARAS
jgi:ArsR family transcriptional regulator